MKKKTHKPKLSILFIILLLGLRMSAQENKTTIEQNIKFENLLKEKQKINSSISIIENYKIQIFYGSGEESKKKLTEFKRNFKEIEGTIIYSNPTYKVFVGNYDTRLEAKKAFEKIKESYPNALLIKPGK